MYYISTFNIRQTPSLNNYIYLHQYNFIRHPYNHFGTLKQNDHIDALAFTPS